MTDESADRDIEGLDNSEYEPEVRTRWGDEALGRSGAAWKALGPEGQQEHLATQVRVAQALAAQAADYAEPGSDAVQALVARHYAWVSVFWVPDREAYTALGAMYADDHRFRANYDKFGDGTAELLRDGIAIWAEENLA